MNDATRTTKTDPIEPTTTTVLEAVARRGLTRPELRARFTHRVDAVLAGLLACGWVVVRHDGTDFRYHA